MRTKLEQIAIDMWSDDLSEDSTGDVNTFGYYFWWFELNDVGMDKYCVAIEDSDGNIAVEVFYSKDKARERFEELQQEYSVWLEDAEAQDRQDAMEIDRLRFQ